MKIIFPLALASFISLSLPATAQTVSLEAGGYVTEKGWGDLVIKPDKGGAQQFAISTIGSNAHTCTLEGEIRNGKAILESGEAKPCVVSFTPKGKDIEVGSQTMEQCRYNCGMRAGFAGLYLKPPATCTAQAQKKIRNQFKRLYDKKSFVEARDTLDPLLTDCGRFLFWLEEAWIRNDMAITLHKLGDFPGCQAVLRPLAADAALSDEELKQNYAPSDAASYLSAIKATRTNLRLCKASGK